MGWWVAILHLGCLVVELTVLYGMLMQLELVLTILNIVIESCGLQFDSCDSMQVFTQSIRFLWSIILSLEVHVELLCSCESLESLFLCDSGVQTSQG